MKLRVRVRVRVGMSWARAVARPRVALVRLRVRVRVRVRVRGGYVPQSEPRWRRVWNLWGGARRDVHRDPTKPAVHKNTKHADRDVAPTCKCCRQNQVVRSGLPAA